MHNLLMIQAAVESFYLGEMDSNRVFPDSTHMMFAGDIAGGLVAPRDGRPNWYAYVRQGDYMFDCTFDSMADALDWICERVKAISAWQERSAAASLYYNATNERKGIATRTRI